jgi:hypothetical protein
MKSSNVWVVSALTLGTLAGSRANPPVMGAALECPEKQGGLIRVSVASDKKSCVYTTRHGDQISLRLLTFTGDANTALLPIRRELATDWSAAETLEDSTGKQSALDAERVAREAASDASAGSEKNDDEDSHSRETTRVDLPGIHINANDDGAKVDIGMIHVDADDDGAEIQMSRDVRMRGEALSREKRGFRSTYILANDRAKSGYNAVGYEAGGPRKGPLAVAVVKSRAASDHDDLFKDVQRLVRANGGV